MLRAQTIEHPDQLDDLRGAWDELAVQTSNPYCAPAWMMAWWKHVAPAGARLRVHAVFDGADLVGLAPFFVDRGFGRVVRYRVLAAGTSAPLDLLARRGSEDAVASETARWLAGADPAPDVIMFEGLRRGSPWPDLLRARWPRPAAPAISTLLSQPAPCVRLRGTTYDQWLASRTSNFRRNLRHDQRSLRQHDGVVRLSASREELSRDLDAFVRLHHARWRARGGSGVLDARVERMLRDAGAELVGTERFRLWSGELDGRVISSHLFLAGGEETAYWLGGFDESERRVRGPARLTVHQALEHSFAAGGGYFDLGPGAQTYKRDLSHEERSLDWVLLVPRGWRAPLARGQFARLRAKQALARRLPPAAKRAIRRALAMVARLRGAGPEGSGA